MTRSSGLQLEAALDSLPEQAGEGSRELGDETGEFSALVRAEFVPIWRLLRRIGIGFAEAEDATQQVFLVVARKWNEVPESKTRRFLYGTALRIAANARRAFKRRREAPDDEAINAATRAGTQEDELCRRRACALLDELLAQLPPELRSGANEFLLGRWSVSGGFEQFGTLPLGQRGGIFDSTPDGSVLVGGWGSAPFRVSAAGLVDLGPLPQGATDAAALAVSDDGNVIAGVTGGLGGVFRWTDAGGMVQVSSGGPEVWPRVNLSHDGSVVAGTRDEPGNLGPMAFRWTEAAGAVSLTPGSESRAVLMSSDGSVIVGQTVDGTAPTGLFVWDEPNGASPLRDALENAGVDLTGWEFGNEPLALSADGHVLVGEGTCGGVLTTYRMLLPD